MDKKREVDYYRILEDLPLNDNVELILVDFEGAMLKALKAILNDLGLDTLVSLIIDILFYFYR